MDEGPSWVAEAKRLRELAAHLVADRSLADDLVQDTWVAALRAEPDRDRPLGGWLAQVLRNFAKKQRRGDLRRSDREKRVDPPREAATPDRIAERLDSQRVLIEALRGLDEPLRTTVVLRYFEDLSSAQIARMQGVPEGTVRWRLKRALDELRVELDARFGGSRSTWCALLLPLAAHTTPTIPITPPSAAAAVTTEGAIFMGTMTKIAVAAAALAIGGITWWSIGSESPPAIASQPMESTIAPPPQARTSHEVELATAEVAPTESARRPDPLASVRSATAATAAPAAAPDPSAIVDQLVDVRFVASNGVPWQGVRFWQVGMEEDTVESGVDGRAVLRLSRVDPPQSLHIDFVATRTGCASASLGATVHRGEATHLGDVVLVGSLVVRGRVVDEDGRGIAKAQVGLSVEKLHEDDLEFVHRQGTPSFDHGTAVESGADGVFTLRGVAPGKWRVWGKSDGRRYGWTEPFEATSEELAGFDVVLAPLRASDRLIGRVVDPKGAPVANAELVMNYSIEFESGSMSHEADAQGRFDFVIWRDARYTVLAWDPDHRYAESALEQVVPGAGELVLQLSEPTTSEVRVHDPSGKPIEGCDIAVQRKDPEHNSEAHVRVVAAGRYQVTMPAYTCRVNVKATGYRVRSMGPYAERAAPPAIDVELEPLPVVRGTVIANGRPLAGATVGLYATVEGTSKMNGFECIVEHSPRETAISDASGHFAIGCAIDREFYVRADADGFASSEHGPLTVATIGRPVELELTHGGAIEGRVLLESGASGEGAIVGINRGDGRARTGRAGPGGVYRFDGLTPGRWQVLLRNEEVRPDRSISTSDNAARAEPIEWSCEVVAGKTTSFDVIGAK